MHTIKTDIIHWVKTHKNSQLLIAFILFWTPVIVFVRIAGEVAERQPIGLEISLLQWIHSQASPVLDLIFLFFTTIGNVAYMVPFTLLLIAYLLYTRQRLNALIVFFGMGGAAAANLILKALFHRDRPAFWQSLITETDYSFPSGHAMLSAALILCIIAIVWRTKFRWTAIIAGAFVVGMIGLSRLYLGVHYPTDIIAGWSVSAVWIVIVLLLLNGASYEFHKRRPSSLKRRVRT